MGGSAPPPHGHPERNGLRPFPFAMAAAPGTGTFPSMTSGGGFGPGRYEIGEVTSPDDVTAMFELIGRQFAAQVEPGDSLVVEYDLNTTETALADLLGPMAAHVKGVSGDVDLTDTLTIRLRKRRSLAKDDIEGGGAAP